MPTAGPKIPHSSFLINLTIFSLYDKLGFGGDTVDELTIKPVAYIKNAYKEKFGVPRQSGLAPSVKSVIEFCEDYSDENIIRGIEQYSHLWLVWGFSKNGGQWSPTVRPPRLGGNKRVGVFATRSPFRPNGLGLSCVKLEEIKTGNKGISLVVSGADLADNTPIYDIKPYLPYVDCIEGADGGFSEEHKGDFVEVEFSDTAKDLLSDSQIKSLSEILSLDPRPSYQDDENRIYGLSFDDFQVKFRYENQKIYVTEIIGDKS